MNSSQEPQNLSTKPYRGTRDFYPELQGVRQALFMQWRSVLQRFGYLEYDAPLLEPLDLYAAKSSDEIVQTQLYSFTDRGDRKVALRPEMTPSLARMVAGRVKELQRPIRWFSIPRCLRYERPQRGRLREFDQLNVDIFGGAEFDEDVEILSTCIELMQALGAQPEAYLMRVNDRRLMNALFQHGLGLSQQEVPAALHLIDRIDKLEPEAFEQAWSSLTGGSDRGRDFLQLFRGTHTDGTPEARPAESAAGGHAQPHLADLEALQARLSPWLDDKGLGTLRSLADKLTLFSHLYPTAAWRLDLSVARGFDYYTGLVFEIFDNHPDNRRALFGGGRYENLVGAFVKESLPGVGFGVSDVSLLNFCEVHGISIDPGSTVDVAVLRFSEDDRAVTCQLALALRQLGLRTTQPVSQQKFGRQIQSAEKSGARCVAFRGNDEIQQNTFAVKWLGSGEQEQFAFAPSGFGAFALRFKGNNSAPG